MQYRLSTLFLLFVVLWSSLAVFGVGGCVVFGLMVAMAVFVHRVKTLGSPMGLAMMLLVYVAVGILVLDGELERPTNHSMRGIARRCACTHNMKQIATALYNYRQANGCMPPAYVTDKSGKPIHSWRVLILPYLNEQALFNKYNFNEPWDGPNNEKLLASRPAVFGCLGGEEGGMQPPTETCYVAVVGTNAAWSSKPRNWEDDGGASATTVMLVEATEAKISWTEPRDLSLDALEAGGNPTAVTVSSPHGKRKTFLYTNPFPREASVALVDGSTQLMGWQTFAPERLPAILRIGGYKKENLDKLYANGSEYRQLNWDNATALVVWLASTGWLLYRAAQSRRKAAENEMCRQTNQPEIAGSEQLPEHRDRLQ